MDITIYHNPRCGSSRNTLGLIRNTGVEPTIIDYLTNPPSHALLKAMIGAAGLTVRDAIRPKEAAYAELNLDNPALDDDALIDAMLAHPELINRPFVVTPQGVRLCRPAEQVLDILPLPQLGAFNKEDGEAIIDADGRRVPKTPR
jgi:arsenate reductase